MSLSMQLKKSRQGELMQKIQKHEITQPFTVQDHLVDGGRFGGKLLINNIVTKIEPPVVKQKRKSGSHFASKELSQSTEKDFDQKSSQVSLKSKKSQQREKEQERGTTIKTKVLLINDEQIYDLINFRLYF